jgi:ferredoxin-NADP reductase
VLSGLLPVLVYWHVPYRSVRWFAVEVGMIWVVAGLMRWQGSELVSRVRCEEVEGTDGQLVRVRLSVPRGSALTRAMPGQHVYVHRSVGGGRGRRRALEVKAKNPFTIVRVVRDDSAEDGKEEGMGTGTEVLLVVRNLGGPGTDWIAEMARTGEIAEEVRVEGPYGEAGEYMGKMLRPSAARGPVLLVAGGVGATYTIPIYMALLDSERLGHGKRRKLKMIWVARTLADAAWGIEILQSRNGDGDGDGGVEVDVDVDVDVFITGLDDLVLRDREKVPAAAMPGLKIHSLGKRPNLESVIDGFFATSAASTVNELRGERPTDADVDDEVAVFVCGPPSLSNDLREVVGRHVNEKGRRVKWIEEVFGFGGS